MDHTGFPADSARMVWVGDAIATAGRGHDPGSAAAAIEAWQDTPVDSATAPMDETVINDAEIDDTEIDDTEIDDTDESVAAGPDIVEGSTRPAWVRPAVVGAVVAAVIVIVMFLLSPRAGSGDGTPATTSSRGSSRHRCETWTRRPSSLGRLGILTARRRFTLLRQAGLLDVGATVTTGHEIAHPSGTLEAAVLRHDHALPRGGQFSTAAGVDVRRTLAAKSSIDLRSSLVSRAS